jgi:hypothetical protein
MGFGLGCQIFPVIRAETSLIRLGSFRSAKSSFSGVAMTISRVRGASSSFPSVKNAVPCRGTEGSNPSSSSEESANHRSPPACPKKRRQARPRRGRVIAGARTSRRNARDHRPLIE